MMIITQCDAGARSFEDMRRAFVPCAPSAGSPLTETMPAASRAGSKDGEVACGGQARSAKVLARRARSGRGQQHQQEAA